MAHLKLADGLSLPLDAVTQTFLIVGKRGSGKSNTAALFVEHCSGCHTFDAAGTEGSAAKVTTSENKDGPNFNQRKESEQDVLYAIENGGFSSGPMPQNIVTGEDAKKIAAFIAKYSGPNAPKPGGE